MSSNIINLAQYIFAIVLNKNGNELKNKAIKIDLVLVMITILIPVILVLMNIEIGIGIVPIFILLFFLFYYINSNAHKLYVKQELTEELKEIEEETKWVKGKKNIIIRYSLYLLLTSVALFIVGDLLSQSLENLCIQFSVPQMVLGIALGFITSLPELITFFEAQKHHKGKKDAQSGVVEATSNLLTSNILNLFIIQSIGIILYQFFIQ